MKHTPGPWDRDPYNDNLIIVKGSNPYLYIIAEVDPVASSEITDFEIEANARLIAAAPDLLEACKESLNALLDYIPTLERNGDYMGYGRKVTKLLQSAIHKAEEGDA